MRVFVTGASGFVGSAVVKELLNAGHQVLGLARSEESAKALIEAGAEVIKGSLEDLESLKRGAAETDGVIHTAFIHDFSQYEAAAKTDKIAIETIGAVLAGTDRPFVVTGGIAVIKPKKSAIDEDDPAPSIPRASETAALALKDRGVRVSVIRLPPSVHDAGDHGFIPVIINIAREKQVAAYVGDGTNVWPAVHRLDAAKLFCLALENGLAGSRYNAIDDSGIPMREIAQIIGQQLNIPFASVTAEEAGEHFGWMSRFIGLDCPAVSERTRQQLGWRPTNIGLIEDITANYF